MQRRLTLIWLAGVLLSTGCITARNYTSPQTPRYAGEPPPHLVNTTPSDTIKVISFNIAFAVQIDSALKVLTTDDALRGADIILLQEMDLPAVRYIARVLGMSYVYYPATKHFVHQKDFGNAVLSRWPIVSDSKIVLPYHARVWKTARTATAATIRIDTMTVRVYSTHLGTYANITNTQRREQMETIIKDAAPFSRVILGGDMNDPGVGTVAVSHGYSWPTRDGPPTATIGRLDHIFFRGLFSPDSAAAGTVVNTRNASDHRPIWAVGILRKRMAQ
ncbi:MAG TPA: endonuclease/exonuclease/phosphatase family protein [Longimicrobiales bacterium]